MTVSSYAAAQLVRLIPRVKLSRAVGRLCEQEIPPVLSEVASRIYARAYRVDLEEAEPQAGPYRTFDEFFTRRLRSGARPLDDAPVISPSDGKVVAVGDVHDGTSIRVKGRDYGVAELVGSQDDAPRYSDGEFIVIYLHPRDYHRVHAPVAGQVSTIRSLPGDLYPVNSIGERHVPGLFVRNQRVAIVIDTPDLGRVTVVMVGATIVGRISVTAIDAPAVPVGDHPIEPPLAVAQGDEIGTFHLGSTVVAFFEKRGRLSRATGPILYGESLGRD